jgi:hypothetical protein
LFWNLNFNIGVDILAFFVLATVLDTICKKLAFFQFSGHTGAACIWQPRRKLFQNFGSNFNLKAKFNS